MKLTKNFGAREAYSAGELEIVGSRPLSSTSSEVYGVRL